MFLTLFWSINVILPSFVKLCDFVSSFSKRRHIVHPIPFRGIKSTSLAKQKLDFHVICFLVPGDFNLYF